MDTPVTRASPSRIIEHVPRWHTSETYILPSDQAEAQRLETQHEILRDVYDGRIVLAPVTIEDNDEVLDVGTGSGAWAIDFLASYPGASKAKVLGIDIGHRLFPKSPPPNATFDVANILQAPQEWNNRFALVHQRLLVGALKYDEWDEVIRNLFRITAPGGWVQLTEAHIDYEIFSGGPASLQGMAVYDTLAKTIGLDPSCSNRLEGMLAAAGFTEIQPIRVTAPIGAWNGDLGARLAGNMSNFFRGLKTPVLRNGGLGIVQDEEEYDKLVEEMEKEWNRPGTFIGWYSYVGKKCT